MLCPQQEKIQIQKLIQFSQLEISAQIQEALLFRPLLMVNKKHIFVHFQTSTTKGLLQFYFCIIHLKKKKFSIPFSSFRYFAQYFLQITVLSLLGYNAPSLDLEIWGHALSDQVHHCFTRFRSLQECLIGFQSMHCLSHPRTFTYVYSMDAV